MKLFVFVITLLPLSLFAQDKIPDTIEAGWKGQKVCEVLHEDDKVRIGRCTYPPGVGQERHYHPPYFSYVLQAGTLRSTSPSGTRESTSTVGRSGKSNGVEWHELLNVGDTTVQLLFVEQKN